MLMVRSSLVLRLILLLMYEDTSGMLGKRRSITATLEESVPRGRGAVVESGSKPESKKWKQEAPKRGVCGVASLFSWPPDPSPQESVSIRVSWTVTWQYWSLALTTSFLLNELSLNDLANVYDVHALHLTMAGNMLVNESKIMYRDFSKLKDDFILLKSKNRNLEHEISRLEDNLSKACNGQDVEGSQLVKDLRSESARLSEEFSMLQDVARLSEDSRKVLTEEVKKFAPFLKRLSFFVKSVGAWRKRRMLCCLRRLVCVAMGDLQHKAMILGTV
nr:hypothetical protein [Tanacetum cinerariifolium]